MVFSLLAGLQVARVPSVVEILRRHVAKKEHVVGLRGERQAEALDARARQIVHRQILVDQVQRVALLTLDRDVHEAQLVLTSSSPRRDAGGRSPSPRAMRVMRQRR